MVLNDLNELHRSPSQNLPNGNIGIDPRFSATYGNPYLLRNSNIGLPTPNHNTAIPAATPAPPPYTRDNRIPNSANIVPTSIATVLTNGGLNSQNGAVPQVARLPNSPTSQYIVPNSANLATIKRGTLATHV